MKIKSFSVIPEPSKDGLYYYFDIIDYAFPYRKFKAFEQKPLTKPI